MTVALERNGTAAILGQTEARLATLVKHAHEAISVLDAGGTILYSTPAARRMFGHAHGSESGARFLDLVHDEDREEVRSLMAGDESGDCTHAMVLRMADADGSWRHVELAWSDVSDDPSVEGAVVVNLRDVTERHLADLHIADVMSHDSLTGLSTRPRFLQQVRRATAVAGRSSWRTVVLSLDIDRFHVVNEEHGQAAGDQVLVTVAARLRASLRQHDTAARASTAITRMGGDEFLLMCENVADEVAALAIARRIAGAVAEPIELGTARVVVTGSIGIAMCRGNADAAQLISDAEAARRHAKVLGEGRQQFFTAELQERAFAAATLIEDLRAGLDAGQFRLVYQPKIALDTNRIVGVEALLRWDHPVRGLVAPDEFIPAAEASGLVVPLGEWVLREACRQGAVWQLAFPKVSLQIAVNVSARQFRTGLASTIATVIAEAGLEASTICLEMTETTVMEDIATTIGILDDLKSLGFVVSIDDFGTGYSSLEYLHRMPIDEVKIDQSFVAGLGTDAENTAIVASVISLAHAMDLDVVAEGVETHEQLARLRSLGCDFAQGYLFARPMPPSEIDDHLAADAAGQHLPNTLDGVSPPAGGQAPDSALVVDDAADVRMLARMSLTAAGFIVDEAGNGAAAIALARRLQPSCVLLDVGMPDMSGIEVCRVLRADPTTAGCTIVMLTTHEDATDKAEAFLAGADDYIVKPFAPRDLVSRIRSAVRRRRTTVATVGGQVEALLLEMLETARTAERTQSELPAAELLSTRQIEILKRLLGGERVPGIARDLYLSQSTIRNHLSSIYQRFGVHSQEQLLSHLRRKSAILADVKLPRLALSGSGERRNV